MIESEDDVRAWVREASGGKARWVEPALGSTPGLPDCWVPSWDGQQFDAGKPVHLELKAGLVRNGVLKFKVRPEQVREIREMEKDGAKVGFVIGVKGARTMIFALPTAMVLAGIIHLEQDEASPTWVSFDRDGWGSFQCGVNFIFSNA